MELSFHRASVTFNSGLTTMLSVTAAIHGRHTEYSESKIAERPKSFQTWVILQDLCGLFKKVHTAA